MGGGGLFFPGAGHHHGTCSCGRWLFYTRTKPTLWSLCVGNGLFAQPQRKREGWCGSRFASKQAVDGRITTKTTKTTERGASSDRAKALPESPVLYKMGRAGSRRYVQVVLRRGTDSPEHERRSQSRTGEAGAGAGPGSYEFTPPSHVPRYPPKLAW